MEMCSPFQFENHLNLNLKQKRRTKINCSGSFGLKNEAFQLNQLKAHLLNENLFSGQEIRHAVAASLMPRCAGLWSSTAR